MKKIVLNLLLIVASTTAFGQATRTFDEPIAFQGFGVIQLFESTSLTGTLTEVQIQGTLIQSVADTYANDLMIAITEEDDIASTVLLQIGGFSTISATKIDWPCGAACDSDAPGTVVSGTVTLDVPLNFTDNPNYTVWIGNGYGAEGTAGAWENVTVTLTGVTETTQSTQDFFAQNISMYPNPATDQLFLSSALGLNELQLTDLNGRVVNKVALNGVQDYSLNLNGLAAGVYFVQVQTNEGVGVSKLVKK